MNWQTIAIRDPYLAGSLAARGREWWMDGVPLYVTAERYAESVDLVGLPRQTFLDGWNFEIADQKLERKAQRERERDELMAACDTGWDPVSR